MRRATIPAWHDFPAALIPLGHPDGTIDRPGPISSRFAWRVEFPPYLGLRQTLVCPSPLGRLVEREWRALEQRFPWIIADTFVVMPNHFHGILWIVTQASPPARPKRGGPARGSIGAVVGQWKSRVTKAAKAAGLWPIGERLWQRGYHDRMLWSEQAVVGARAYLAMNPIEWERNHGSSVVRARSRHSSAAS